MPTLTVNGRRVTADAEHTILDAARAAGIVDIPTLCWYPKLPIVGNCRICLVSVEGQAKLLPADRKSTRLNSSHSQISYAVFCLKKKNKINDHRVARPAAGFALRAKQIT